MEKYIQLAKELNMVNALIISPQEISFDIRAILKCRWGCEYGLYSLHENIKCHSRDTTYQERVEMVNNDWRPSAGLADFLAAGPPPVCIGFGSMVDNEMDRMTELVKKSLARAGLRGILVGGWGALGKEERRDHTLCCLDSVPYDWLLPRVAAVVHHGGAGTIAASLRAGVPSAVIPFFSDQPFWARRIHMLGVGPRPIPRNRLTVKRLASALRVAVEDEGLRKRAAELGRAIRERTVLRRQLKLSTVTSG